MVSARCTHAVGQAALALRLDFHERAVRAKPAHGFESVSTGYAFGAVSGLGGSFVARVSPA
jgi:hypothetical protein